MKTQKTPNNQRNPKKENWSWKNQVADLHILLVFFFFFTAQRSVDTPPHATR